MAGSEGSGKNEAIKKPPNDEGEGVEDWAARGRRLR